MYWEIMRINFTKSNIRKIYDYNHTNNSYYWKNYILYYGNKLYRATSSSKNI